MNYIDDFSGYFKGDISELEQVLDSDRNIVNALDSKGYSLLHWAAVKNNPEAILMLLDRYDSKLNIPAVPSGYNPFQVAIW